MLAQARLDRHVGPFAVADVVLIRFLFFQRAKRLQLFRRDLARLETVEPDQVGAGLRVHRRVGIHDVGHGQLMALTDCKIRFIVRGRDLQHAGAELEIDLFVADDRDELLFARQFGRQRTQNMFADELRVTRVLRVDGHRGVAGNGFRSGRRDGQPDAGRLDFRMGRRGRLPYFLGHFHFEVVERPVLLFHDDLLVRYERSRL